MDSRKKFLDLAEAEGVNVRCLHFKTDPDLIAHLNHFRNVSRWINENKKWWYLQRLTNGETALIPRIAFQMFRGKFVGKSSSDHDWSDEISNVSGFACVQIKPWKTLTSISTSCPRRVYRNFRGSFYAGVHIWEREEDVPGEMLK